MVILITGKKGAGKTYYAQALQQEYESNGIAVKHIDGDAFRNERGNHDFSDEGRLKNLMDASKLAASWEEKGFLVIMSFIAPKRLWRNEMRKHFKKSRLVYIPGGTLWEGTEYECPYADEFEIKSN